MAIGSTQESTHQSFEPDVPPWFTHAVRTRYSVHEIDVEGASISYQTWGPSDGQPVVLVHGGGAVSSWWDHVAPYLCHGRRVIALDLSGHGNSSWRADYSFAQWGREVLAVGQAESAAPPVVIGHSMGGFVSLAMAGTLGEQLAAVVAIDSPIGPHPTGQRLAELGKRPRKKAMTYPDLDTILSRFHTMPDDPATLGFIRDYLAPRSVRQVDTGWQWKFDTRVSSYAQIMVDEIDPPLCRAAFIRGERGLAIAERMELLTDRIGPLSISVVPDAGHHIMLDQPIALIAALDALLEQWRNT